MKRKVKSDTDIEMSFLDHIRELRKRLFVSFIALTITFIVAFIFYEQIVEILIKPLKAANSSLGKEKLFINSIYEGFAIRIKISFITGIVLSLPVHLYNIIKFIFPGLKRKEKKIIIYSLISSFFLILFSIYYGYFKIIPVSVKFLTDAAFVPANVGLLLNFGKNIFYILQFLLIGLLIFQLPLILELLLYLNMIKRKTVLKISRFIVVGIFVLSAIVTPPDIFSQIAFALPLIVLYYLAIIIAKIFKFGE